jgi:hypothetical protein
MVRVGAMRAEWTEVRVLMVEVLIVTDLGL